MAVDPESSRFWDMVEHEFRVKRPVIWRFSVIFIRLGMLLVLISLVYFFLLHMIKPPSGYFMFKAERLFHPILWTLMGVFMILGGAYMRFRALGPLMDEVKRQN